MSELYFFVFILITGLALIRGIIDRERIYQYSFFMAATFAIFLLPQAISLIRWPGIASPEAIEAAFIMACLCVLACVFSEYLPINRFVSRSVAISVDQKRLFHVGVVLTIIGLVANFMMGQEVQGLRQVTWTGPITVYHFFSMLLIPALAINIHTAIRRGGRIPWAFTLAAAYVPIEAVIFHGRREVASSVVLIILLVLFYQKRVVPSRVLIVGGMIFAAIAIPATEAYRQVMTHRSSEIDHTIDLISNFDTYINKAPTLELRNAAIVIETASKTEAFEFGTGYWDQIVWRFIPAQLVGQDIKQALMFGPRREITEGLFRGGYIFTKGSTVTGLGDSFLQFGYFGALFFLILGVFARSVWLASLKEEAIFAQLLYMCMMTSAMRTLTHQTVDFLPGLLFILIFLGIGIRYARAPGSVKKKVAVQDRYSLLCR